MNHVLCRTITEARFFGPYQEGGSGDVTGRMELAFRPRRGYPEAVPLRTRFGWMQLYLGQRCETSLREGMHQVATVEYQYKLFAPDDSGDALLRWEYVKRWPREDARWCRHHLQGPLRLSLGDGVGLNELHLPTGYVVIEDVIRFCINDLEVEPLSAEWHTVLEESYERFRSESTPPR